MKSLASSRPRQEIKQLMFCYFWNKALHWSTGVENHHVTQIQVGFLPKSGWYALMGYHPKATALYQELPKSDRSFLQIPIHAYQKFSAWLVSDRAFQQIHGQLQSLPDVTLVYLVPDHDGEPLIPTEWAGLKFYPQGVPY